MLIKILLLVAFFAVTIGVGVYCRKKATDVSGFVLGGRAVGPWLTAFAYGTSYFSAVIFIGYAGQFGWKFGIAATWIGIGNAFLGSLLAWMILGRRTRLMSHHFESATMPDFFGKRYNSKKIKLVASLIVFVFLIPYTASLYNGLAFLFESALGIPYVVCVIAMALITGIYVIAGGYTATAINDFIQGIIMIIGIIAVVASVLSTKGGLASAVVQLAEQGSGEYASLFGPDPISLFGTVLLTSLGTWGLPQMVQKFYAIKDEKAIVKGTVISTVFAVIVAGGCYFLGGFGRLFVAASESGTPVNGYDHIIPTMIIDKIPDIIVGVVLLLVLSASMSTLSSLVLTSSSTLTIDFIKGNIVKKMSQNKQLVCIRILVAVFIIISAVIALVGSGISFIADLMGISWGALAGAFLAPFIFGLYWKRTTKVACWASFGFGTIIMVLNMLLRPFFPAILQSPVNCGALAMIAGLIIVPVVSLFTKAPETPLLDAAFDSVKKKKLS